MSVRDAGEFKRYITEFFNPHKIAFNDQSRERTVILEFDLPERNGNWDGEMIHLIYTIPRSSAIACTLNITRPKALSIPDQYLIKNYDELHALLKKLMDDMHDAEQFKKYIRKYFQKYSINMEFTDDPVSGSKSIKFNLPGRQTNQDRALISFTYEIPDNKLNACTLRIEIKETTIVEVIEDYDELHSLLDKECEEFLLAYNVTSQSPIVNELHEVNQKLDHLLDMIATMIKKKPR